MHLPNFLFLPLLIYLDTTSTGKENRVPFTVNHMLLCSFDPYVLLSNYLNVVQA